MTDTTERALTAKIFGGLEIKSAERGEVEAIVATLNVVDRDQEVILPGAIPEGAKVKLSAYGHDAMWGDMPVGKGTLHIAGDKVVFRGQFFMGTARGADAFHTLKELGADQEWSFGFRVIAAENATEDWVKQGAFRVLKKLEPFEVSPVILGAGLGTRTVAMKHADAAAQEAAAALAATEAKAVADAAALVTKAAEDARLQAIAAEEFDRFQRTLRKYRTA